MSTSGLFPWRRCGSRLTKPGGWAHGRSNVRCSRCCAVISRGLQTCTENYLLMRDNRVWMSLSPVEIESLAPHLSHMRGHVVIAGLGIGLALYNALLRPAVRRITVLECDSDVIALFTVMMPRDMSGSGRFDRTDRRSRLADRRVGRLPLRRHLGQDRRPRSGRRQRAWCQNLRPKSAGYWGMEADFVSFLARTVQAAGDAIAVSKLGPCARRADHCVQQPRVAHANSRCGNTADFRRLARSEIGTGTSRATVSADRAAEASPLRGSFKLG